MLAVSLALAPALMRVPDAEWVDLDGPLLLENDRVRRLLFNESEISSFPPELWG